MDTESALREKARSLENSGDDQAALDLYSRIAREAAEPDPAVLVRMGNLQLRLGREQEAASSYSRAADALAGEGLADSALALLRRVLRIQPDSAAALLRLAAIGTAEGYTRETRDSFLRYLDGPGQTGDPEGGLEVLRTHLRSHPRDEGTRQLLADRLNALGRAGEAAEIAAEAPPPGSEEESAGATDAAGDGLQVVGNEWAGAGSARRVEPGPETEIELLPTSLDEQGGGGIEDIPPVAGLEPTLLEGLEPTSLGPELEGDRPADDEPLSLLGSTPAPEPGRIGGEADPEPEDDPHGVSAGDLPLLRAEAEPEPGTQPEPGDLDARYELLARLRDRGDTAGLAAALEGAHPAFAAAGRLAEAADLVHGLLELRPGERSLLTLRAEYALRSGDDARSAAALLALGRVLGRASEGEGAPETTRRAIDPLPGGEARDPVGGDPSFRARVAARVDAGDAAGHFSLGLAFRAMGLLDDAISELQVALEGGADPLATLEALGHCLLERGEPSHAARVFRRAAALATANGRDLVGLRYWIGRCEEELGSREAAREQYELVLAVDRSYRDAASRVEALRSR